MTRAVEKRFGKRETAPQPRACGSGGAKVAYARAAEPAGTEAAPSAVRRALFPGAGRHGADRLAGLDILRLVAALAVVMYHFGYAGGTRGLMDTTYPGIADIAKYGFLGVDLFFLISGFVITASAYGRSWHQFAISRFLRLYPAHVVCMTTTAIVVALLAMRGTPVTPMQWLANLTMLSPALGQPFMDGAYWSIVIEIVFYGWVAVMVATGVFERRLLTILTVWLAISYVNEVMFQYRPMRFAVATEYAAMFAGGMLIQRLRAGERSPYAWALLGFAFGLGGLHAFEVQRMFARLYADTVDVPLLLALHVALYALFIGGLWLSRSLPSTRMVLTIGGLTYPLYLVHQQAGYALIDALAPVLGSVQALGLAILLALVCAYLVHRYAEPAGRRVLKTAINAAYALWRPSQAMLQPLFATPSAKPGQGLARAS